MNYAKANHCQAAADTAAYSFEVALWGGHGAEAGGVRYAYDLLEDLERREEADRE